MRKLAGVAMILGVFLALSGVPAGGGATSETGTGTVVQDRMVTVDRTGSFGDVTVSVEPLDIDAFEVSVTSAALQAGQPMAIRFMLWDGEQAAFSMPGDFSTLYRFNRQGARLLVSAEQIEFSEIALVD